MRLALRAGAGLVFGLLIAGCTAGDGTSNALLPTPNTNVPLSVYVGTLNDSLEGLGSVSVSLSSTGAITGGTWTMTFAGKSEAARLISGTVSGNTYSANISQCSDVLTTCVPDCHLTFTGSLTSTALVGWDVAVPAQGCPSRSGSVNAGRP